MLHHIDHESHGPYGQEMAKAVSTCVHCGYCLAACPTYQQTGIESESPRGRIILMKEVLERNLDVEEVGKHLDQCLGCLACEPACPSGVAYHKLITPFRAITESKRKRSIAFRIKRTIARQTLPYPKRFRLAAMTGKLVKKIRWAVPKSFSPMVDLLPATVPKPVHYDDIYPARGEQVARVALLIGCAQSVLDPDINLATIDVLQRNGVEVVVPKSQGCCGALSWHVGDVDAARQFARNNIRAFSEDVSPGKGDVLPGEEDVLPGMIDAVVTNAAGCGSGMQEYGLICQSQPDQATAETFAARVKDVSVLLHELGGLKNLPAPLTNERSQPKQTIVYQDACHLACAQGVKIPPRDLLGQLDSVQLMELPQAEMCCGSAGTYNIDQPEMAAKLGQAKAKAIVDTGADLVASGNIGCLTQINLHLQKLGSQIVAKHTMQVIRDAYLNGGD